MGKDTDISHIQAVFKTTSKATKGGDFWKFLAQQKKQASGPLSEEVAVKES